MNPSEPTGLIEMRVLVEGEYIQLFSEIAHSYGISYIATPDEDSYYQDAAANADESSAPLAFSDNSGYTLTPCRREFSEPFNKTLNLMLYESYMTLIDAGLATPDTPPPFTWNDEGFVINRRSTLATSQVLCSFDRTIGRLAALAQQHDFCEGKAISPLWMTRSLNEVISSPEPSLKSTLSIALEN